MLARDYMPGDEVGISGLFDIVFGRKINLGLWKWRYLKNPYGRAIIRVMFDEEQMVGHYAVIPVPLCVKGKVYRAAFSMTTMTHPDYRGKGIFTSLASDVYDLCSKDGISLVFGFPNKNSYHGFVNKLGWQGFGPVEGWETNEVSNTRIHDSGLVIEMVENLDKEYDKLWDIIRKGFIVAVPRDRKYMEWRYIKKPGNEYAVFAIKDSREVIYGIIVLKIYIGEKGAMGHIVDILVGERDGVLECALNYAIKNFFMNNITKITCWLNDEVAGKCLKDMGFRSKEWPTFFGVKILDRNDEHLSATLRFDNWRITMGDSDVF